MTVWFSWRLISARRLVILAKGAFLAGAALLLAAVGVRVWLALWASPVHAISVIIIAGGAVYVTALLEGLSVAAGKLRSVEADELTRYANARHARQAMKIEAIGSALRGDGYSQFLIGQQILTIVLVIATNYCLDWLAEAPASACGGGCTSGPHEWITLMHGSGWGLALDMVSSPITTFLISSLLVCWVFQLGPGLLAEDREVAFLRMPGTGSVLRLLKLATRCQLGFPGFVVAWIGRRLPFLVLADDLATSPKTVYEALLRMIGVVIANYHVVIDLSDRVTMVTEVTEYEFHAGVNKTFQHRVVTPADARADVLFEIQPEGLVDATRTRRIVERVERLDANGALQQPVTVICYEIHLTTALPRNQGDRETLTVTSIYELPGLDPSPNSRSAFDFSAQKPVENMIVEVRALQSLTLATEPEVVVKFPGELSDTRNDGRARATIQEEGHVTRLTLTHLVHAARVEMTLNATN